MWCVDSAYDLSGRQEDDKIVKQDGAEEERRQEGGMHVSHVGVGGGQLLVPPLCVASSSLFTQPDPTVCMHVYVSFNFAVPPFLLTLIITQIIFDPVISQTLSDSVMLRLFAHISEKNNYILYELFFSISK